MSESPHMAATADDLVALLDWYRAAGVDGAVAAEPMAWLSEGAARSPGAGFAWPERADRADRGTQREPAPRPASAPIQPAFTREELRPASPAGPAPGTPRAPAPPGSAGSPRPPPGQRAEPGDIVRAPPARFATGAPDAAETQARRLARSAPDIPALAAALQSFEGCALKATAKHTCVYRGAEAARLMIIGEAPGRDEDLEGRPFVGRAGQLLDRMLAAIDVGEADVHITNVVYWRPPGNRTPTPQETQICRPFLERQVELVAPDLVLLLGGAAAKAILDTQDGIMRLRGKWRDITLGGRSLRALATLHPAYLLRTPAAKRTAWRDLLALKSTLEEK